MELDPAVVRAAADLGDALRERAQRLAPRARITWVAPERMHVTLAFLGELNEARTASLRAALTPPLTGTPFDMVVEGVGVFPASGPPRVIWAGIGAGRERLIDTAHQVSGRLSALELPIEERFHPHVTLARVRDPAGLRRQALLEAQAGAMGTTRVRAITLFESRLSPKGPTYVPVRTTAFQG